jgi:hypothetical protein
MLAGRQVTAVVGAVEAAPSRARDAGAPKADHDRARRFLDRSSGFVLGFVALIPVGNFLWVALHRIGYPFELEWLEGGSVSIVQRASEGHSLYVQPSLHFVGWPYTPLYFWVSAAVAHVTGNGFLPLRLVSFTATLATFAVIYALVRSIPGSSRSAGLCAVGVYAATFRLTGAWIDIGRVDSLFLLLVLLAVLAARRAATWRGGVLVGGLVFLAFFTKQTALVAALPLVAWLLAGRPRVGLAALGTSAVLVVGSTVAMNAASDGWYGYYVFGELAHQPVASSWLTQFWSHDLWRSLGVGLLVGAAGLGGRWASRRGGNFCPEVLGLDLAVVLGLVFASWVGRLHSGGWDDVLIPAAAGVALLFGHGVAGLRGATPLRWRWLMTALLVGPLVLQLGNLRYSLPAQVPTATDQRAGAQLVATLRRVPGQVVVLDHPWYAALAGKATSAQGEAINEVLRSSDERGRAALLRDLPHSLSSPGIGAVVLDAPEDDRGLADTLRRDFVLSPAPLVPGGAFYPVTDLRLRPTELFVRRPGS